MLSKHPDTLSDDDLRVWIANLVADRMPEGARLDYKQTLELRRDGCEIAKDVSSFANEVGGTLLYGIAEERGSDGAPIPKEPYGIEPIPDFESRVENILVEAVQPTLPEWRIRRVPVTASKVVYVVWTPESWVGVHMVESYGEARYYRRGQYRSVTMREREVQLRYERLLASRAWLDAFLSSGGLNYVADRLPPNFRSHYVLAPLVPLMGRVDLGDHRFREWLSGHLYPDAGSHFRPSPYGVRTGLRLFDNGQEWFPYTEIYKNGAVGHWRVTAVSGDRKPLLALINELHAIQEFITYGGEFLAFVEYAGPVRIRVTVSHPTEGAVSNLRLPAGVVNNVYPRLMSHDDVLRLSIDEPAMDVRTRPNLVLKHVADELFRAYGLWDATCFDEQLNLRPTL